MSNAMLPGEVNDDSWIKLESLLNSASEVLGLERFLKFRHISPSTVTIYNTSTVGAGWTLVQGGLTDVISWKMNERTGQAFRYAYVPAPATYMTAFGALQRDTSLSAIYVQRIGAVNLDMELEVWTI